MNKIKQHICSVCGKSYDHNKNLNRHVSQAHPEKISLNTKIYDYPCEFCGRKYNHARNLNHHKKLVHGAQDTNLAKTKCPLCAFSASTETSFIEHLVNKHSQAIKFEEVGFSSVQDFTNWKQIVERDTLSRYVKKRGSHHASGNIIQHYYICHRSGHFVSESKGIRNLKKQGTNKIEGVCPASIRVSEAEDGSCKIKYISTHVGHQNDMTYVGISEAERKFMASNIVKKIPVNNDTRKVQLSFYEHGGVEKTETLNKVGIQDFSHISKLKEKIKQEVSDVIDNVSTQTEIEICKQQILALKAILCAVRDGNT